MEVLRIYDVFDAVDPVCIESLSIPPEEYPTLCKLHKISQSDLLSFQQMPCLSKSIFTVVSYVALFKR